MQHFGDSDRDSTPSLAKPPGASRMVLDLRAIEEAEQNLDRGGVTPYGGPWPRHVICGRI